MTHGSPRQREFFLKRGLGAQAIAFGILAAGGSLVLERSYPQAIFTFGVVMATVAWLQRRTPLLAIDDTGVQMSDHPRRERFIPAAEIAGWSLDPVRKHFAFHLQSREARLVDFWRFSAEDRLVLQLTLEERGYPRINAGEEGRAAIRRAHLRFWKQAAPGFIGVLLLYLGIAAIWR